LPLPPGTGTFTVRGGIRGDALGIVLVVRDVASSKDATVASAVAVVVVAFGGSFKFARWGSVTEAMRGSLIGASFAAASLLRFAFFFVILSTDVLVGIAGKPYSIIVRCWDAKLWERGWLGATCGCHSNYVVQT
jgi:hypothetical protein